jgi:hypothetical protein
MILALSLVSAAAWADPIVNYTVAPASGAFMYNLTLDNTNSTLIVSGLIVVKGFSVFGLDSGSPISAPPEANGCPCEAWGFAPPIPPFADNLEYFSPDNGGDISPGGTLSGFSFTSFRNPSTLNSGDFDIVLVVRGGTMFVDIGDAQLVPEPSMWIPLALAVITILGHWRLRVGRGRTSSNTCGTV